MDTPTGTGPDTNRDTGPDTGPDTGRGPSIDQALLAFRIIGASLGLGVTLFALLTWFLQLQGPPTAPDIDLDPAAMFNVLLLVAVGSLGVAVVWWRARVQPLLDSRAPDGQTRARFADIQTNVIITWALAEAPAIFAVVYYYLFGDATAGALGVAIIWLTLALTWPKRAWFEERGR